MPKKNVLFIVVDDLRPEIGGAYGQDNIISTPNIDALIDRSFTFILKTPPASVLLAKAAQIPKGSGQPNSQKVGSINKNQLQEIATTKLPDLNTKDIKQAMKIIEGTAKNMGVVVLED